MLNNAQSLDDLRVPPGNRLEVLRGALERNYQRLDALLAEMKPEQKQEEKP